MSSPLHLETALEALLHAGFMHARKHESGYQARLGSGSVLLVAHPASVTDEVRRIVLDVDTGAERRSD